MNRAENRTLNLEEYRRGTVELVSRPRFLIVELTQGCNLTCPMCRPSAIATRTARMGDALFERIADELFATAEVVDLRGWGESLILPDVELRIRRAAEAGVSLRFVTNLAFSRPAVLALLADVGSYLSVSVDTVERDLFSYLRGGADLDRVRANLQELARAYQDRHGSTDRINLTTTVQRPALGGLPQIVSFAHEVGIREIRLFSVTAPAGSPFSLEGWEAEVDAALARAGELAEQLGVTLIAGTRIGSMPPNPGGLPACIHPWCYAYFAFDGSVGFCDHLIGPEGAEYCVGDLNDASFEEIWNGPAWTELRREHLTQRRAHASRFEECAWCYEHRFVDFEDLFVPESKAHIRRL